MHQKEGTFCFFALLRFIYGGFLICPPEDTVEREQQTNSKTKQKSICTRIEISLLFLEGKVKRKN
jgi:hypothetical protein